MPDDQRYGNDAQHDQSTYPSPHAARVAGNVGHPLPIPVNRHVTSIATSLFAMGDHISMAGIDPSETVFVGMAILAAIALTPRFLRFSQRRGRGKR